MKTEKELKEEISRILDAWEYKNAKDSQSAPEVKE